MKKQFIRINYYAEKSDFEEITKVLKETKDLRMRIRYEVILNYLQGYSFKEIGSMHKISSQTVSTYIKKYKKNGVAGLIMGKSTGAPRHFTKQQEAEIINIITTKNPEEFNFKARVNWDTNIIRQLVSKLYGVSFCQRGMFQVLYRNGLSFTQATYSLEKADLSKQEEFKKILNFLRILMDYI